jgi:hypothetical protein
MKAEMAAQVRETTHSALAEKGRSFVASLTFTRLAGLRSAALIFAPAMGSAHRAFVMALCLSRVSGLMTRDRELARLGVIPSRPRKKWADELRGTPAQGYAKATVPRLQYLECDRIDQPAHTVVFENIPRTWSAAMVPLSRDGATEPAVSKPSYET